ncbi:MAG: FRG domain-containing protein [Litorimonas sp.]
MKYTGFKEWPFREGFEEERESHWYTTIRPHTESDAYDLLRLSHPCWANFNEPIFRGHADSNWDLIPSAWRNPGLSFYPRQREFFEDRYGSKTGRHLEIVGEGAPKHLYQQFPASNFSEAGVQELIEFSAVKYFHTLCDELGMTIPELTIGIENQSYPIPTGLGIGWYTGDGLQHWEPTDIFGLAQHHGVPTRLLDFTKDPKKALLFALKDIINSDDPPAEFCVWAFKDLYMLNLALSFYRPNGHKQVKIERCTFSSHLNKFLHSQSGLFLFVKGASLWKMEHGSYPSLNGILDWFFPRFDIERGPRNSVKFYNGHNGENEFQHEGARVYCPLAIKICMPFSMASKLYEFLVADFLSDIHLMPTFDNVASYVRRKDQFI